MRRPVRLLLSLVGTLTMALGLMGVPASAAETVYGNVGLYFLTYGDAIDRDEAERYATSTNVWLRRQGIPRERATLGIAGFTARSGPISTGCNAMYALHKALNGQDLAAIEQMTRRYEYVIPIVIGPNKDGCGFAGQALLGAPGILLVTAALSPSERLRVFRHELGHNLGLAHFASAELKGSAPQLLKPEGSFRVDEYGDSSSIMGRGVNLTFTDRLLLGSLAPRAGLLAHPRQDTYVLRDKGNKDRLLAIPVGNQVRVTLEYSRQRGVEARTIYGTSSVLWVTGSGASLKQGSTAMASNVRLRVVKAGGATATVKVTWPKDTTAPRLEKDRWHQSPWDDFQAALVEATGNRLTISRVNAPVSVDHTTVPTYKDLQRKPHGMYGLLPAASDSGWVSSATLIVNGVAVYRSTTNTRSMVPAGTYADWNGRPERVSQLSKVPLYRGRNYFSYILVDAAGNRAAFHYTFRLTRLR